LIIQPGGVVSGECDGSTLEIWGTIDGEVEVANQPMKAVRFVLLPAGMGPFTVYAPDGAVMLRTYAK